MRATVLAVLLGLVAVITASTAEACSRNIPAAATKTVVPAGRINQSLLDQAVRVEVNYHRCRAGLPLLGDAGGRLAKQTEIHSKWMARTQNLSHRNTVSGSKSLQQRVKSAGIKVRAGAENIGMVHRYRIDNKRFKILNSSACQFSTYEGQALPAHTYASLARHAVALWMSSPGHRKNILNRKVSRVSTTVAFDPKSAHCGRFWLTQTFVG